MAIDEMQNQDQKEEYFDDEEEDGDICECCGLPLDLCSWGKPDEWDDEGEADDNSQDLDYKPEEDEYSYSDSDSEV